MDTFLQLVQKEATSAVEQHGEFNSLHEAYAVLLEEVDEFWDEVRLKEHLRDKSKIKEELVQVAACCLKAVHLLERE